MLQYFLEENKYSIFENNKLPQLLYLCNTETMQQDFPRVLHKHNDRLEIVFIVKGKGNHLIGDVTYQTKAGDILIFNQNVIHDEMAELNSGMVVYCCGIKDLHIKGMEKNCLFDITSPAVIPSGNKREIIEQLFEIMFLTIKEQGRKSGETCRYLLSTLLTLLVKLPREKIKTIAYKKLTLVEQVKQYLDTYYAENLTLEDIAFRFNISPFYLVHLFKQETQFSPIQYLIRRRIGEAQSLLINTRYSISKIAGLVGYDNANYFSSLFNKMIGVSPTLYRTSWIGKKA
ncbi:AraC-like DNA-binding protein [Cricetibacter osteomyelitidis]|uniref:AraC-like DNA-binding protein n=1 Tax=Cricetibacter osteomyelitidis TaxID=1521931 RepID=A0A4R2TAA2_9PAST|nr:AraC family transcriptional regulator [Cricetibacter osteomyelitidis]TCP97804.1 AraC-like DNA-binding protein [Cricetibacter osteomyelitidis]